MRNAPALALALSAALCACHGPQPSPEYRRARDRHFEIIASYPLDAYARPEMDEVVALLERVPKDSLDAEAAAALRDKIAGERQALVEEQARRAKLVESARAPTAWVGGGGGGEAAAGPAPGLPAAPAAPARAPSQLAAGTPLVDFQKAQGDCFEAKGPARIGQREGKPPLQGEAWGLKDAEACRKAHPAEVDRMVLFAGGKLVEVREAREAKATPVTEAVKGVVGKDGAPALAPGLKLPPGAKVTWSPPAAQPPAAAPGAKAAPAQPLPGQPAPSPAPQPPAQK